MMTVQQRQQAFVQAYNQAMAALQQQYGFTVEARLSVDGNGSLAMVKAELNVAPLAGWQAPTPSAGDAAQGSGMA
jgi:hypothetical protein